MGWWLMHFACQPCSLVSHARVLAFPGKIPCWLTLSVCLTSFWSSFPSSSSPCSLTASDLPLSVLLHLSLQCPACCGFIRIGSVPGSLLFLTICLAGQQRSAPKNGSFLFEHRCSKCSQAQLGTYSFTVSFLLLKLKIALERESRPVKRWIISSSSEWVGSTGNACSGLLLAALTPHGLTVLLGMWQQLLVLGEVFEAEEASCTHTQVWCRSFQATASLAPALTPLFMPL